MKKGLIVVRIVLVLAVLGGGYYFFFQRSDDAASRVALGTLERDRVTLAATAPELIVSQPVAEGSAVQVGTLLVQLDTTLQQASLRKIEADITQQEANLEKLNNGVRTEEITAAAARVDTAKTQLLESERDYERTKAVVEQKLAAQASLETAETRRDGNRSRLRDAEAQLALLKAGSRNEDIAQAEAQLIATHALLSAEQQKLTNLSITATVAGTLDSLPWNVGERVATGSTLAILLAGGAPYARIYIPETSRVAINVGTSLTVHVDGVAEPITGRVRWIAQDPAFTPYYALNSSERSRLVYMAEIQLPDTATNLPAGLPAQVDLP